MIAPALTQTGMFAVLTVRLFHLSRNVFIKFRHLYLRGISQPQAQRIAVYQQFHRVAQRRIFQHLYLSTGYHTHVKEVLTQCALSPDLCYDGTAAYFQFLQCHFCLPSLPFCQQYIRDRLWFMRDLTAFKLVHQN